MKFIQVEATEEATIAKIMAAITTNIIDKIEDAIEDAVALTCMRTGSIADTVARSNSIEINTEEVIFQPFKMRELTMKRTTSVMQ